MLPLKQAEGDQGHILEGADSEAVKTSRMQRLVRVFENNFVRSRCMNGCKSCALIGRLCIGKKDKEITYIASRKRLESCYCLEEAARPEATCCSVRPLERNQPWNHRRAYHYSCSRTIKVTHLLSGGFKICPEDPALGLCSPQAFDSHCSHREKAVRYTDIKLPPLQAILTRQSVRSNHGKPPINRCTLVAKLFVY